MDLDREPEHLCRSVPVVEITQGVAVIAATTNGSSINDIMLLMDMYWVVLK